MNIVMRSSRGHKRGIFLGLLAFWCFWTLGVERPAGAAVAHSSGGLENTLELEAFFDGIIASHRAVRNVPAAAIAVVKDGEVLFAKGYGNAHLGENEPVDPQRSMFRAGSVSKLLTWTAIMQLVERGVLDLDADINTYMTNFKIPETYAEPIRLRHIMTHTAGFEDGGIGYMYAEDPQNPTPMAEALARHVPARVRPPGTVPSYSNYSAALAGLIVEQVSGVPFNDYIRQNILVPLGMRHTTFAEPLPTALQPHGVARYTRRDGINAAEPFQVIGGFRSAGALSTTAIDMAHFMLAHLQNGRYGEARILQERTARLMHAPAFRFDDRLPGMALGFQEYDINGQRGIGHGGDIAPFHSELVLIPGERVGIFVALVGEDASLIREGFLKAFYDRYFPPSVATPNIKMNVPDTTRKYVGSYIFTNRNHSSLDKLFGLMAQAHVTDFGNGRLLVSGLGREAWQLQLIGSDLFEKVDDKRRVAFRVNEAGEATHLFIDGSPLWPLERTKWHERSSLWLAVLVVSMLTFAAWLAAALWRRRETRAAPIRKKRAVWLATGAAAWGILTILALAVVIAGSGEDLYARIPFSLKIVLVMPIVFTILAVGLIFGMAEVWRGAAWKPVQRIHYTLVVVSAVGLSLFFYQWNILGWQFG